LARTLKDSVNKYKTMRGYRVIRKAGWIRMGFLLKLKWKNRSV
jgi:isoleucyl-tRNA synthetase